MNSEQQTEPDEYLTPKIRRKIKIRPLLSLNLPENKVFFKFEMEDNDKGSVYLPASLFYKLYTKKEKLGEGASALVRKYLKQECGQVVAVKTIRTRDDEIFSQIKNEFRFLRKLNHVNIIKAKELYYDEFKGKIYYVMEYFPGQNLQQLIFKRKRLQENEAKVLFRQLIMGIYYLHSHGIVHRDLKPDNILITNTTGTLKILDFNVAKFTQNYANYNCRKWNNFHMQATTGTLAFTAPEVYKDCEYTEAVDAWSAGCILFNMLTGYQPFHERFADDLVASIATKEIDFNSDSIWENVSEDAKHLLKGLLEKDPTKRTTIGEAMYHFWTSPDIQSIQNLASLHLTKTMSCSAQMVKGLTDKQNQSFGSRLFQRQRSNSNKGMDGCFNS